MRSTGVVGWFFVLHHHRGKHCARRVANAKIITVLTAIAEIALIQTIIRLPIFHSGNTFCQKEKDVGAEVEAHSTGLAC